MLPELRNDLRRHEARLGKYLGVLARIARLRVITPAQAYHLVDAYRRVTTVRSVAASLERLSDWGYLTQDIVEPRRGAVSAIFYRLTTRGGYLVSREPSRALFSRPPQHILRYLLFRNTVYARARADGWRIASPIYSSPANLPEYLRLFNAWARRAHQDELARLQRAGARAGDRARAEEVLGRLERFLPTKLTFEFLYRLHETEDRATDIVLLVIDDPRRAICRAQPNPRALALRRLGPAFLMNDDGGRATSARRGPPRPGPQWEDLPNVSPPGLRLLLRDSSTHYDLVKRETFRLSKRLLLWRARLNGAGSPFAGLLATDTLYPDLWANRYAYGRPEPPMRVVPRRSSGGPAGQDGPGHPV